MRRTPRIILTSQVTIRIPLSLLQGECASDKGWRG